MANSNNAQELLNLKKKIDDGKQEAARIEGQITQLEQQRAQELGCSTDAEAEEYIQELTQDIAKLDQEINDGLQTIKEELGW